MKKHLDLASGGWILVSFEVVYFPFFRQKYQQYLTVLMIYEGFQGKPIQFLTTNFITIERFELPKVTKSYQT